MHIYTYIHIVYTAKACYSKKVLSYFSRIVLNYRILTLRRYHSLLAECKYTQDSIEMIVQTDIDLLDFISDPVIPRATAQG
jgi:hypothetical protein